MGLTHGTVSRALQDDPRVKPETRDRILAASERLGYVPSRIGRSLKSQRTNTLGIIVPYVTDPFYSEVIRGVYSVILAQGYNLFVAAPELLEDRHDRIVATLREQRVDGVFLCLPGLSEPFRRLLRLPQFQVVTVNHPDLDDPRQVWHDERYAVEVCVRYLLEQGHERIAYLGNQAGGAVQAVRLQTYQDSLKKARCSQQHFMAEDGRPESGYRATRAWLTGHAKPATALFCYNDTLAIGALRACHEHGQQLSVMGFDDIELAPFMVPALTTFAQPKFELGRQAATMMLGLLDSPVQQPTPVILRGRLVVRESVLKI